MKSPTHAPPLAAEFRPRSSGRNPAPRKARSLSIRSLHPRLGFERLAVARALRVLDRHFPALGRGRAPAGGELSVAFLTDSAVARLHGQFLADSSPTDVITFAARPGFDFAGEICVSVDAAVRFAGGLRRKFGAELMLYLIHGWLHLAGHDDRRPADKRAMRRAEARAMRFLIAAGAVPRFGLLAAKQAGSRSAGQTARSS